MYEHIAKDIPSVLAAIRAAAYQYTKQSEPAAPVARPPFVTISRQPGAGGRSLARQLAARLNVDGGPTWTVWDDELVERVATEHGLPIGWVECLEDAPPTWLEECLAGLAVNERDDRPDEFKVYHRVAATIRALAEAGHVIIVGRGAVHVTRDLAGGVHLRLVAPFEERVDATAAAMAIPREAAAVIVRDKDHQRAAFHRRHWPSRPLVPENFTATFNTAAAPGERLVESIVALLPADEPHPSRQPARVESVQMSRREPAAATSGRSSATFATPAAP